MEEITVEKLFELYTDTLEKCGMYLLDESNETIEYNIFEDFDIGVHSFFHPDNLNILFRNGFISENKLIKSIELRDKIIAIQNSNEWAIEYFRLSPNWKEALSLCDEIKTLR